ncbi:DMT family transporter [Paracoccus seriniphilus]|uniref:Permease of the drug/metabolite transporter (DMT) superfamily n=2 Tax=Paracoccus seriniphilus TaxID=184748 RepID=A0A239PMY5_9RHOB|nr:DMT family transporter [Paracoccus seriniphilus]SNT71520.1 Permease of the drug/metabolite transporter (DMT) superfamily [Paracoccus seriniphilus]
MSARHPNAYKLLVDPDHPQCRARLSNAHQDTTLMHALSQVFSLMRRGHNDPPSHDKAQLIGIALLCGAVLFFTLMDATAKYLTQSYSVTQVVWARFFGNALIVTLIFRQRVPALMRSRQPALQFWRAMAQLGSVGLFFTSLQFIGLAEATAIMDSNPVLITLGAALFLKEKIGIRRMLGIAAALVGALIVIRPGTGVFQPAALLPVLGAFTYAGGALLTRLVRSDSTATSILWSAYAGLIVTTFFVPFSWQSIALQDLPYFLALAVLGTISQILLIKAFSMGEAGSLAPFGYTALIWAGFWGWLFFDQLPDRWTILGGTIIVGAGLYVWSREAQASRKQE